MVSLKTFTFKRKMDYIMNLAGDFSMPGDVVQFVLLLRKVNYFLVIIYLLFCKSENLEASRYGLDLFLYAFMK